MPMATQSGVVMGFPADYFEMLPRYQEPASITSPEPPLPCNNPDEKLQRCVKWLVFSIIVMIILLLFLAYSAFYLTYHQPRVPIIRIESLTLSNINYASPNNTTTTTNVSANWHLTFSLENPNKFASIHYKKIQVWVFHKNKRLSSGYVDNIYQEEREEGRMKVEVVGLVVDIEKEKSANGAREIMVVSLKLDAVVLVEPKFMRNHWQLLQASCGDVQVLRPSMNLTFHESRRCNVNLQ